MYPHPKTDPQMHDLSAIVTVVLIQYNKNEKLRESLEELLKMFRDRTVNESEEDF